ncbi:hypothetical protein CLOM_g3702, partial [Closterium sp. NIES-68]
MPAMAALLSHSSPLVTRM